MRLRLLGAGRTSYYADDLSGPMPWGVCGSRALAFEQQAPAMSDGQGAAVYGADVDAVVLAEAGYVADEGLWWARSMRQVFDPARFFVPIEVRDPFGNPPTQVSYDADVLFAMSVTDALGNVASAEYDYRVLAPRPGHRRQRLTRRGGVRRARNGGRDLHRGSAGIGARRQRGGSDHHDGLRPVRVAGSR